MTFFVYTVHERGFVCSKCKLFEGLRFPPLHIFHLGPGVVAPSYCVFFFFNPSSYSASYLPLKKRQSVVLTRVDPAQALFGKLMFPFVCRMVNHLMVGLSGAWWHGGKDVTGESSFFLLLFSKL